MAKHKSLDACGHMPEDATHPAYEQEFPSLAEPTATEHMADELDDALDGMDSDARRCVELVILARLSYRDAAVELGWTYGAKRLPDKKRVWRTVQVALDELRGLITPPNGADY